MRAIIPVDILGTPVDFDRIVASAKRFGLAVVEDATESLGTRYRDLPAGARADISCFSFNGNKLITTGGGGMLCTNNDAFAKRARYLTTQAKDDPIEYVHGAVGYNYRLTNVQAAIGLAQIEKLAEYVEIKRANAMRYSTLFADLPGITPMREPAYAFSTFWLYTIMVNEQEFGISSRELLRALAAKNIQARPLWQPMHQSPAHKGERAYGGDVAAALCRDALSLPSSVGLTDDELARVATAIREACGV